MSESPLPPYRSGLATGAGIMLAAGAIVALTDVIQTGGGAVALLALWALFTLPLAVGTGLVLGAGNATWGPGWVRGGFRRLRDEPELDRAVSAMLVAAAIVAAVLIVAVATLAVGLVGDVERKTVGGLLLGVVVVVLVPVFGLAALPAFRASRWLTGALLRAEPVWKAARTLGLSLTVVLVASAATLVCAAGAFVVLRKLDYQALNLGSLIAPALVPVVAVVLAVLAYGPLARLRERIPARGPIVAGAAVVALAFPLLGLGSPSPETQAAVIERSYIGARAVKLLRGFFDADGDGHSAFFGGPDCDDGNPDVHPDAPEIPGNGIDDNCAGGDAPVQTAAEPPKPDAAAQEPASTVRGGKNVLVIFVDTLRYDRLGVAGYRRDGKSLTPRIDAFAGESVVFTKAFAQAPNTPRSVPSFLGSRYPSQVAFDVMKKSYPKVLDENELLFEVLKPAGFTTIGMSSHFYFCDRTRYPDTCKDVVSSMNTNVTQGADLWDNTGAKSIRDSNKDIAGPRILEKTIAKLEELANADQKFAMLVHLFEPHSTYMVHEGYPITERGTASLEQKYDYEIAVTDAQVGQLLDTLDRLGIAKDTTVVLLSDHGEAFGVHTFAGQRMFFHGQTLYRELIHVPLMFRVPGIEGRMVDDVVQMIDVSPTIAQLFGIAQPASWVGRSLAPAIEGKPLEPRPAFSELLPEPKWDHAAKSMVTADGTRHVFYRISDARWEIYDLVNDPDERKNIVDTDPDAEKLKRQLIEWMEGPLTLGGAR